MMEGLRARMLGRGKKKETVTVQEGLHESMSIQRKEEILRDMLGPMESYIMTLQSVLVWEKPQHSAALLLTVNGLFWLATTLKFYYLVGMTGMTVVFLERWTNYIWPEIRVPPPPDEDTEEWTPVHPHLVSVPEICQYLAEWWDYTAEHLTAFLRLRKTNHPKFFIFSLLALSGTAVFGHYVSGFYICYFTVMGAMLVPCALYHNIFQHAYEKIAPHIRSIEDRLRIKRTPRKSKGKRGKQKHGEVPHDGNSSSEEIEEFVPQPDEKLSLTLEKAADVPESSDEEATGHTPGLLTPNIPSVNPSRDHSDVEFDEEPSTLGDLTSLAAGLASIPAHDDSSLNDSLTDVQDLTLEDATPSEIYTESDLPSEPAEQPDSSGGPAQPMEFVSSHFRSDSEEDEEEQLAQGLSFPDVLDSVDSPEPSFSLPDLSVNLGQVKGQGEEQGDTVADALTRTIASAIVSQTLSNVSNLMTSTMAGLSNITESVVAATRGTEAAAGSRDSGAINDSENVQTPSLQASADTDILEAEFEFLDREDLDSLDIEEEKN